MTGLELRKVVFDKLEHSKKTDLFGRVVDLFLILLISVNIVSVILETVDWIDAQYGTLFQIIEYFSVVIFSVEYLARLWSCVENPAYEGSDNPRLQYMLSPLALIDLLAILPFYLGFFVRIDLRFLRILRLLRIFKLTRYSSAMSMLLDVLREEASAFFAGFFILMVLLVLASSGAYLVEHDVQPVKFGSIPAAMWWAMATLTTVGYGDVTPITPWGQLFGGFVAIIGIGMAALPAGILASGLADQLRRKREQMSAQLRLMLEDGIIDEAEETELEDFRKDLGLSRRIAREIRDDVMAARHNPEIAICQHCGKPTHKDA